jgi:hypothetical protein
MRITGIAMTISLLLILLAIPGCDFAREQIASIKMPGGTDLSFETLLFEYKKYLNTDKLGGLEVFSDNQGEITGLNHWITDKVRAKILSVDFSRYFVLAALMGDMGNTSFGINVIRVWQNKRDIYVKVDLISPKAGSITQPAITSPKHVVKVSKEKMPEFGKITFHLIDKFGRELANSSQDIPPYLQ